MFYLFAFGLELPGQDNNNVDRLMSCLYCDLTSDRLISIANLSKMGVARLELAHPLRTTDFKSVASTIPPHPQVRLRYLNLDDVNMP